MYGATNNKSSPLSAPAAAQNGHAAEASAQSSEAHPKVKPEPPVLPLIIETIKRLFAAEIDSCGDAVLPSAECIAKCEYPLTVMQTLSGAEKRAELKKCGVTTKQMPVFLRALQHVCATHVGVTVRDPSYHLHQRPSSSGWCIQPHQALRETVVGRSFCINSENAAQAQTGGGGTHRQKPPRPSHDIVDGEEIRAKTGCIGIKNQGSTCYLNSLLQTLFHLGSFTRAIYQIPVDEDDFKSNAHSIPLALQLLSYDLETSNQTAETTGLTTSFGWSARDTFIQHDIHELTRILLDNLEEKLKKTGQGNIVHQLFGGETESFIDVPELNYRSSRKEPIYDLQLVVKDCANIYESLDRLFESEWLDGPNKYCLERDGTKSYHRAERGMKMAAAPPVLFLHLTRFDYDPYKDDMCKVLSRWDYYDVIDLKKYLPDRNPSMVLGTGGDEKHVDPSANDLGNPPENGGEATVAAASGSGAEAGASSPTTDGESRNSLLPQVTSTAFDDDSDTTYQLHSVLVHQGSDAKYGHYFCYIRVGDRWLKFNDETVSVATKFDVFGQNFGGNTTNYWGSEVPKTANAYMLVYIRRKYVDQILGKTTEADYPKVLRGLVEKQREEEERARKEKMEEHLYVKLTAMTDEDIAADPSRLSRAWSTPPLTEVRPPIRRKLTEPLSAAADEIETVTGIPVKHQVLFAYEIVGMNYRCRRVLSHENTFHDACIRQDYRSSHECVVYVADARKPHEGSLVPSATAAATASTSNAASQDEPTSSNQLITFHKVYDPSTSTIVYLGSIPVDGRVACEFSVFEPKIRKMISAAADSDGAFFVPPSEELDLMVVLQKDERSVGEPPQVVESGFTYIWQAVVDEDEATSFEYPTAESYMHFLEHKITLKIHLNVPPSYPFQFKLTIADDAGYEAAQKQIARLLQSKLSEEAEGRNVESLEQVLSRAGSSENVGDAAKTAAKETQPSEPATNGGESNGDASHNGEEEEEAEDQPPPLSPSKVEWRKILLAIHNPDRNNPYFKKPEKRAKPTVRQMLKPYHGTADRLSDVLYFEIAPFSVEEMESSNPLLFEYFDSFNRPGKSATLLFPPAGEFTVEEMLQKCADAVGVPATQQLRLVDVWRGKYFNIYDKPTKTLKENFEQRAEYHLEALPQPIPNVPAEEQDLINVAHFHRLNNVFEHHDNPFSLYITKTDLVEDVMDRVAMKLGMPQQAVADWKPSILINKHVADIAPAAPVLQQWKTALKSRSNEPELNFYLGLEHAPLATGRRGKARTTEGLRIYH